MTMKLGKAPAKQDHRTLKLNAVLVTLPEIPTSYDCDENISVDVPLPMFANDTCGDCVIAGRAHQSLRFEAVEQSRLIEIVDKDVVQEYFKETGGVDTGLVVLDSLKAWRKGWRVSRRWLKRSKLNIYAFAQIDETNQDEVEAAIYLLTGAGCGLQLPISASLQFDAGETWDVTRKSSGIGSWGGHYVYLVGYNEVGPICVTWAKKQQMTWKFFKKYCDEAYGIIDNKDSFLKNSTVDVNQLSAYLQSIEVL